MKQAKSGNTGKPAVGSNTKLEALAGTCDLIGMTDIPVVSQAAELVSAGISVASGDYVGAGLSVASMLPVVGKVAEGAKLARRAKRVGDGISSAQKNAKLLTITAKNADEIADAAKHADDVADAAKNTKKASQAPSKPAAPQPSKTQAQKATKKPEKEIQDTPADTEHHFDSDVWLEENAGMSGPKPAGDSIFAAQQPGRAQQSFNYGQYNAGTNSNPALNNPYKSTGSPLYGSVQKFGL